MNLKITEYWVNLIIGIFILMLFSYLISQGWKSAYFTNVLLIVFAFVIATVVVISIPKKPTDKEISLKEKYTFSNALLLISIYYCKDASGVDLKNILQNNDFIDRSCLSLQELKTSTENMLSINMIEFIDKKYHLTDKFYHYFNESFNIDKNPWNQVSTVHALLNSLNFEMILQENMEIDFFNQEEYDSALKEYISAFALRN